MERTVNKIYVVEGTNYFYIDELQTEDLKTESGTILTALVMLNGSIVHTLPEDQLKEAAIIDDKNKIMELAKIHNKFLNGMIADPMTPKQMIDNAKNVMITNVNGEKVEV